MTKYTTILAHEITCPYCRHEISSQEIIESWQRDQIRRNEEIGECGECGKKFHVKRHLDFECNPDCELNGMEHDLVFRAAYLASFCSVCGKCVEKDLVKS